MAIEMEFKYILRNSNQLEEQLIIGCSKIGYIEQGYLSKGGRIRSIRCFSSTEGFNGERFLFTYKHKLANGLILEIETDISKDDYDLAWADCSHKLTKNRYYFPFEEYIWEFDCFRNKKGNTYLMLAECEVDPAKGRPQTLHPHVIANCVYSVEENDKRFANRKLSNPNWIKKISKDLGFST